MLGFQNIHQIVFNLSQVTSAVTSGSVRVSSTVPVKKKTEIDVFCNESFLQSLNRFHHSENIKLFEHLPMFKFGSKYQDIQWIYSSDVNIKLKSNRTVNHNNMSIKLHKNDFENFSKDGTSCLVSLDSKKFGEKQIKLLAQLESKLINESNQWSDSFISKGTFELDKESSACGVRNRSSLPSPSVSPITARLIGSFKLKNLTSDIFSTQKRGFKTKRAIQAEKESRGFFPRFGKVDAVTEKESLENPAILNKSNKYIDMMADESLSSQDKVKLKVSFAEGYMVAANEYKKGGLLTLQSKLISIAKNIVIVTAIIIGFTLFSMAGRKVIFPFNLGHHGEVDPEEVGVTFADVKGVEEVKEELQEIVEFLRNPNKFSSMGGKLPRGVLLVGPPGTGKTLLARAVAGEANVPFFHVSGSEFDEIFVGEGARRVRNLFRSAKAKAPAIIFIDEIDCVGSKRKSTMLHPYANQTINQLLSEMDGFTKNEGVIVLGATNRKSDLDSALLRPGRFDVEVLVPLPDLESRQQILELYTSKILSKDIDIEKVAKATAGCTGADLEAMINHAAIRAATEGASYVTMEHIENAKDKIMIGPERKNALKNEEANLITAYHEGGHTVVAYFSEGVGLVDKVTIVPRGESLGHTSVVSENEHAHITKAMCLARIDVALGGRAAEELFFGVNKITVNASNDLDKATAIATSMVKDFGMSDKIGLRTLKSSDGELVSVNQFGQTVADQVDIEVKRLIQESYDRVKGILKKHGKELKLLAEALVKYKTLSPEDVKAILEDNTTEKGSGSTANAVN